MLTSVEKSSVRYQADSPEVADLALCPPTAELSPEDLAQMSTGISKLPHKETPVRLRPRPSPKSADRFGSSGSPTMR
jgi:hypothetical protein